MDAFLTMMAFGEDMAIELYNEKDVTLLDALNARLSEIDVRLQVQIICLSELNQAGCRRSLQSLCAKVVGSFGERFA